MERREGEISDRALVTLDEGDVGVKALEVIRGPHSNGRSLSPCHSGELTVARNTVVFLISGRLLDVLKSFEWECGLSQQVAELQCLRCLHHIFDDLFIT